MTTTYPHAVADALALVRTTDHDAEAAVQVVAAMTELELAEMVCNLAALVGIARDTGRDLPLDAWAAEVLRAANAPS